MNVAGGSVARWQMCTYSLRVHIEILKAFLRAYHKYYALNFSACYVSFFYLFFLHKRFLHHITSS